MWNLEKWFRGTCLQDRKRDRDTENKCMDTTGGRGGAINLGSVIDIYTLLILCIK